MGDSVLQHKGPQFQAFVRALRGTQHVLLTHESVHLNLCPSLQGVQDFSCGFLGQAIRIDELVARSQHTKYTVSIDSLFESLVVLVCGTRQDPTTILGLQENVKELPLASFGGIPLDLRREPILRIGQSGNIHGIGSFFHGLEHTFHIGEFRRLGLGLVNESLDQGFIAGPRSGCQSLKDAPRLENTGTIQGIRKRHSRSNRILQKEGYHVSLILVQGLAQFVTGPHRFGMKATLERIQDFIANIQLGGQRAWHKFIFGLDAGLARQGGCGLKRGCQHFTQRQLGIRTILRTCLRDFQVQPGFRKGIHLKLKRAVHRRLHQNSTNLGNHFGFGLNLGTLQKLIQALPVLTQTTHMEIHCTILVGLVQRCMATRAHATPHNLFQAAHIEPRIQHVNLADKAEINAFRHARRCHNDTAHSTLLVFNLTHTLQDFAGFGSIIGDQCILSGGSWFSGLLSGIRQEGVSQHGQESSLFQSHGKQSRTSLNKIGLDQAHTFSTANAFNHRGKLRRLLTEFGGG